jgi:hypothetical protein
MLIMPVTFLKRNVRRITQRIEGLSASGEIDKKQRQNLFRALFYVLMGEPIIPENLIEFCRSHQLEPTLNRLFEAMGVKCKLPQALHSRILKSVSLKRVQDIWGVSKSDLSLVREIVREADLDPEAEHHLLHRYYESGDLDWLADVENEQDEVDVIISIQALEEMLLGVFETYKVPKSRREPFSEVFGLCLGMASRNRTTKKGQGQRTKWFVYVEKAVPQIRAKSDASSVIPNAKSISALVETSHSLFPQLEIIGDYHSHPYHNAAQIRRYRGWEASQQDAADIALLYRDLRNLKLRKHRMRVSFVIAIARGKATKGSVHQQKLTNVVRFNMAGCHIYISAYRILSDGSMSEKGVTLQSPYRERVLKVA